MKLDELLVRRGVSRRSALIAGASTLMAAGTAGVVSLFSSETSSSEASSAGTASPGAPSTGAPSAGAAGGAPGRAAGAPGALGRARSPVSSSYRLSPLAGFAPVRPARTPVRDEPFLRVGGLGRTVVLTFDDGPDPRYTPEILRTLGEHGLQAMFFVCGNMAKANPDLLRRVSAEGHVIGNHTWSHPLLTRLSRSAVRAEMERTSEIVEKTCGERPAWFRAPYGAWNREAYRFGAELGMEPMAWTVDTLDWRSPGVGAIADTVEKEASPGAVVLSHDAGGNRSQSVQALRRYLPRLLEEGYHVAVPRRRAV
ncbi:polysaccharide deacetylase family protein [Streptomyces fragilis]|uniref:Polysaccharide deacetylase family protein n=1 Tax=Streptomyces fragilis TaxID=67301 RepID=A0ABV2YKW0_9ACTN|nr:polysaccharide deacetylase family protein [Streptomyces fragilis]